MGGTTQAVHCCSHGDQGPALSAMARLAGMRNFHHFLYFPIRSPAENWLNKLCIPCCLASVVRKFVDQPHCSTACAAELISDKIRQERAAEAAQDPAGNSLCRMGMGLAKVFWYLRDL